MAEQEEKNNQVSPLFDESLKWKANQLWLVIFTDLVALMLAFFVLLFSMSTVKLSDWKSLVQSLSETLSPEEEKKIPVAQSNFNIESIFRGEASNLEYLVSILSEVIDENELLSQGSIEKKEDHISFVMSGNLLFGGNGSNLSKDGREAMFALGGVLRNIDNEIGVDGHSSSVSLRNSGYDSNWELSTALAAAIANTLRESGYPRPITAFGYAENKPLLESGNAFNKKNSSKRRIEVIIRPEAGAL